MKEAGKTSLVWKEISAKF